jgi:DNA-binding transcriptional LysR family regulator
MTGPAVHTHRIDQLDLNLLTVFDALLREHSVTRAGQALGLTQSAMSHSLKRLRTWFDDPLFVKTHRGVAPTAKALALGPAIVRVMETVREDVLSQSRFEPLRANRTFNLCMSDMGELVFLPTLIRRFKEVAPLCRINSLQVAPDRLETVLGSGEGDLALSSVLNAPDGLYQEDLFPHTFVCIVSVKNRTVGQTITLDQYSAMPHVAVTLTGRHTTPYDAAIERAGVKRDLRLLTPHFLFIPLLLDQHPDYISTVPRELGNVFARHGIVRTVEPPVPMPVFMLKQYWHPRFHHDRASTWLRALIRDTFPDVPQADR